MRSAFTILSVVIIFTMCNPPKQEATTVDTVHVQQQQDSSITEQPTNDVSSTPSLTSTKFEEIPVELQQFLEAVNDRDKLAGYLNTALGCYIIEEGAGIYPSVSEVKQTRDFFGNTEFLLFMNSPKPDNAYFINQQNVDPCNLPFEGIYFTSAKKDNHFLLDTYQSYLAAANDEMPEEVKTKLNTLDAAMVWSGNINLANKTGDLNTFNIYLAIVDKKLCLAAIDTRGCGI